MSDRRPLATTREVAEYLGVPERTLGQWAHYGIGPRYCKIGRHRRYRWSDVEAWVASRMKETAA
jgi:excisionase family DNA binding protein